MSLVAYLQNIMDFFWINGRDSIHHPLKVKCCQTCCWGWISAGFFLSKCLWAFKDDTVWILYITNHFKICLLSIIDYMTETNHNKVIPVNRTFSKRVSNWLPVELLYTTQQLPYFYKLCIIPSWWHKKRNATEKSKQRPVTMTQIPIIYL